MEYTDQMGRTITLGGAPPKRIVSVVPSQTEWLFDLGLDEEVVGITKFCVHPEAQFRAKTKVGGTKQLHLERIAALEPDLIVGNKEENTQADIEWLAARFPVWMSEIYTFSDALDMMTRLGQLLGRPQEAQAIVQSIAQGFEGLAEWLDGRSRSVAYLIWRGPYMAAGGGTYIHEMLRLGGFENVFAEMPRYPVVTLGQIQEAGPEAIFLSSEPYPFRDKHVSAIQAACPWTEVRLVDGELFSWYGSRMRGAPAYFQRLWK